MLKLKRALGDLWGKSLPNQGKICQILTSLHPTAVFFFSPPPPSSERGEGHDRQNEPTEDQLCHPQQWPLDRPSLLQPPGGQQDLQGDEEDGEQHGTTAHP